MGEDKAGDGLGIAGEVTGTIRGKTGDNDRKGLYIRL